MAKKRGKRQVRKSRTKTTRGRRTAGKRAASRRTSNRRTSSTRRPLGFAVVGLGHIAQAAVLPAFKRARNAELVALVSSDEEKLEKISRKYRVKHTYSYEDFDDCLKHPDVDAVYIALPNDQHEEYAVRAAKAGVHVLCEKPMALNEHQCRSMIDAARESDVRLMIAYRLHFEPANLAAIELAQSGKLGDLKFFTSEFSFQVQEENIRIDAERGGGAIWDIGVYCVNAARYLFRSEPIEVFAYAARGKDERFVEVHEGMSVTMRFPDERLASFTVSFGASATASYRLVGTKGDVRIDNAYEWQGGRELTATISDKKRVRKFKPADQFAAELAYFSDCVAEHREPEPGGVEGLADVRIVEAILESARHGRPVPIEPLEKVERPSEEQRYEIPPPREPELVNVEQPHQG